MNISKILYITAGIGALAVGYFALSGNSDEIDYSTQVKPILNKNCIACHGGVKKQGGFSVLFREEALGKTKSGKPAIIPGDPEHSDFIARLSHSDPEERMPYKTAPLKKEEIEILTKWVKQGAKWGEHWAFTRPKEIEVPNKGMFAGFFSWFGGKKWEKNDIDYFVSDKLEKEGLKHADQAEKGVLLRRVSLDLIGLPPTEKQLNDFLADNSDDAYEKAVDQLLKSPQFGERWAGLWLDMARYSDSKGYEKDEGRSIWKYRDYVIKAFNDNMPYNQFLTEQLAGDLLPNPTKSQYIATAFHRNTMNNDEGGTDDEEFRTAALLDRVNTTWEMFQGTTFACVQCHSHPYDPIRHDEYYKYLAFFNNTRDEDVPDDSPFLREFKSEDSTKLVALKTWLKTNVSDKASAEYEQKVRFLEPKIHPHWGDQFVNGFLADNKYLSVRNGGTVRFKQMPVEGKTRLMVAYGNKTGAPTRMEVHLGSPDGKQLMAIRLDTTGKGGWTNSWDYKVFDLPKLSGKQDWFLKFTNPKVKPEESTCVIGYFILLDDFPGKGKSGYETGQQMFMDLVRTDPAITTPVMFENPADFTRKTQVFDRGSWLTKGKEVQPDVPKIFGGLPGNLPKNRLGLAKWLGSKENPLTARVAVNRFWEQIFGVGLVETLEDFGTQGFTPSNPELLDFLATRFMNEYNWQPKELLKEIVMSATYQQDSKANAALLEKDPMNRFLARGPRVRLNAEQIRDQALLVSGLLSYKMYGKSVMPYQPDGIWNSPYSGMSWRLSDGEDQWRRAVYTYWRRSGPYPSLMTFDGGSREVCLARRIRTNTPLQALTTMNDPVYVECSKFLAKRMLQENGDTEAQIRKGYRLALSRDITPQKLEVLLSFYQNTYKTYQQKPKEADKLLGICKDDAIKPKNIPSTAAMTMVASAILNLDEFITKQ